MRHTAYRKSVVAGGGVCVGGIKAQDGLARAGGADAVLAQRENVEFVRRACGPHPDIPPACREPCAAC